MERIIHAIDEAALGSWREAAAELRAVAASDASPLSSRLLDLIAQLERAERERRERQARVGQEIGNTLAIAQATLEGMLDGVLQRNDAGLEKVHDAVLLAGSLLGEIAQEPAGHDGQPEAVESFDLRSLVDEELLGMGSTAAPKGIHMEHRRAEGETSPFRGDLGRVRRFVREALFDVVRSTHPGGRVEVLTGSDASLVITVRSNPALASGRPMSLNGVARLLRRLHGRGRVLSMEASSISLAVELPFAST